MLKACKPGGKLAGKTPVYYSYIIAFTARTDLQLKDCNVGSPNLCEQGANYMRQKKARILAQYEKYASETVTGPEPVTRFVATARTSHQAICPANQKGTNR